jgi:3-deoxy-7-phosphoheptulonate synthase
MIEVHNDPANAWSDGEQCLTPDEFARLMDKARRLATYEGRSIQEASTILTN